MNFLVKAKGDAHPKVSKQATGGQNTYLEKMVEKGIKT